jgi:hypothetical protein
MRTIDRRLANLEQATGIARGPISSIVIDWFSGPVTGAECEGVIWTCGEGETKAAFKARICRDAPPPRIGNFQIIRMFGETGECNP